MYIANSLFTSGDTTYRPGDDVPAKTEGLDKLIKIGYVIKRGDDPVGADPVTEDETNSGDDDGAVPKPKSKQTSSRNKRRGR